MSLARKQNEMMDYARARASEWGAVLRQSSWHGAPNKNYYRETPYVVERTDTAWLDSGHQTLDQMEREMRAMVVDRFYRAMQDKYPVQAEAMFIEYVFGAKGTRWPSRQKERLSEFYRTTKRGKRTYFEGVSFALDGLGLYLRTMVEE